MYREMIYENADGVLASGQIGDAKVIRVFKTETVNGMKKSDALRVTLHGDLKFLQKHQGSVSQIHARAVDECRSAIIILKHENKTLSHLAVNLWEDGEINETFRLEVAGKDGLLEYDSDKAVPVYFGGGLHNAEKKSDHNAMRDALEQESDQAVLQTLDKIMKIIGAE